MDIVKAPLVTSDVKPLLQDYQFEKLLNQDQAGRRISLLGSIGSKPAILLAERAVFPIETNFLKSFSNLLQKLDLLSANDIYYWLNGWEDKTSSLSEQNPDYKLTLIYPCTDQHVKKYSTQGFRTFTETPDIYKRFVRPYMEEKRGFGRLDWIFNILDGTAEQKDILYRERGEEGFVIMPDLNWNRRTIASLHLLGIVERRDIWSIRDLTKDHIPWLRHMREKFVITVTKLYPDIEEDQVKIYIHYHPTYYHFHVHIVHIDFEGGITQAVGKAQGLENVISQLEVMAPGLGMADTSITYGVGEKTDLWKQILLLAKQNQLQA